MNSDMNTRKSYYHQLQMSAAESTRKRRLAYLCRGGNHKACHSLPSLSHVEPPAHLACLWYPIQEANAVISVSRIRQLPQREGSPRLRLGGAGRPHTSGLGRPSLSTASNTQLQPELGGHGPEEIPRTRRHKADQWAGVMELKLLH